MARPKGDGKSMSAEALRRVVGREEFDYVALMSALKGYARPRDKVTALLRQGTVVRVKKGLYVFGAEVRRGPFSLEILANTIYGPSYLSLQYALAHYGLIPEGVTEVTSVSLARGKRFETPVGRFSYHAVPERAFGIGVDQLEIAKDVSCLMATREKALADTLYLTKALRLTSAREMRSYLTDSLRIDEDALAELDGEALGAIAERYDSGRVSLLANTISLLKKEAPRE
jgi:predicted transcriptional regulator of viral defense system